MLMVPASEFPLGASGVDASDRAEVRAYRYTLPTTPAATASVDIGHVGVQFELFFDGELAIDAEPLHGPADDRALRACTLKALRAMARGLMVSGIGSYSPNVNSAAGHTFAQVGYRFQAPNTMTFAGTCSIDFGQHCDCGTVVVRGEVQYCLDVTAMPSDGRRFDSAEQPRAWFLRHEEELASIGVVVLMAVPIAPGQLVGGDPS
jgi:hypothetical protein